MCGSRSFDRVTVKREPPRPDYVTDFMACKACRTMSWRPVVPPKPLPPSGMPLPTPPAPGPVRLAHSWGMMPPGPTLAAPSAADHERLMQAVRAANRSKKRR